MKMELQSKKQFDSWVHKFGVTTGLILLILISLFPVIASSMYDIWPNMQQLWPGFVAVALLLMPYWPAETIGYMPIMGPGALYMSYITGNVTNLRMPVTIGTIRALNIEPNTDKCHTMAIVACGASIITTVVVVALGLVIAVPLQPLLESEALRPAFDYVIPALFGGLVAQNVLKDAKTLLFFLVPLAVCLLFNYLSSVPGAYYMLIGLACALAVYMFDYRNGKNKEKSENAA
jgi:hypothetical protein